MSAPVRWLGGSPVLVHNLLIIAGFALTAFAAYVVASSNGPQTGAAFVAAWAFAFNTHLLVRLAHVQALHAYGLPLALLATDRLLVHRRMRDALWLALWMTVMAYTSGHFLIFATVMIAVAMLSRPADWVRAATGRAAAFRPGSSADHRGRRCRSALCPITACAIEQGLVRSWRPWASYSATLKGYLAAAGRLHYSTWSEELFRSDVDAFFPGVVVLALSLAAVGPRMARSNRGCRHDPATTTMLIAIGVIGMVLSLGTNTPVYGWLYAVFPPFSAIRAAARFGNLFLLAIALLAGMGAACLRSSGVFGRHATAATIAFWRWSTAKPRAPFHYSRFDGIPNLYSILAREPGRVVLVEQPFYPPQGIFENAEYVLNSTAHWRPLMNGYSGHMPKSYREYAETFWYFPREHAIQAMRKRGRHPRHGASAPIRPRRSRNGANDRRKPVPRTSRRRPKRDHAVSSALIASGSGLAGSGLGSSRLGGSGLGGSRARGLSIRFAESVRSWGW